MIRRPRIGLAQTKNSQALVRSAAGERPAVAGFRLRAVERQLEVNVAREAYCALRRALSADIEAYAQRAGFLYAYLRPERKAVRRGAAVARQRREIKKGEVSARHPAPGTRACARSSWRYRTRARGQKRAEQGVRRVPGPTKAR